MTRWWTSAFALPLLALLVYPGLSASYEAVRVADGGTIVGTVTYGGDPPPPEKLPVTKDEKVCGSAPKISPVLVVGPNRGIKDVVVSIANIQKGKAQPKLDKPPVLDQKQCEYHPYAQIFPVNTTLEVLNSDDVLHNVKTKAGSKTQFNMAQPKFKRKLTVDFKIPEIVQVECNVHGWMHAVLVVTDHPYYALTDANGAFTIADVPPGKYTLKVWHPTLGEQTKEVAVDGKEVTVAFELKP
jgi:hypothetical protein